MDDPNTERLCARLKRIEGQVRGLHRMVEEDRYCMDILTQTAAVTAALRSIEEQILDRHLRTCVAATVSGGSDEDRQDKMEEVLTALSRFRKR